MQDDADVNEILPTAAEQGPAALESYPPVDLF